jgi:transitional endoplasmic reticulum ATPase
MQSLKGVVVIGATNRPDILDPALLRPGRFDRVIFVPPPDYQARLQILKIHTKEMPLAPDVNLGELARITEGYTGADLESVCREAALTAARENLQATTVSMRHFKAALEKVKPSITEDLKIEYERILRDFKKSIAYIS